MSRFAALLVLIITIITVSTAMRSESAPAPEKLPPGFQNLERKELPNGLRILIGRPLRPALFSEVLLVVRAGTGTTGSGQEEIARIAAQTLLTDRRSQESPSIRVELARLGVSPDFTVGREVAVFRFAVPTVNTHSLLHLLADLLNRRKLPNGVWEDAMAQRARELTREQSDPWQRATTELASLLWANRPDNSLPHRLSLPIESETLSAKALAVFWEQRYAPGNMILSIWGNFPIDDVGNVAESEFGILAAGNLKDAAVPAHDAIEPLGDAHAQSLHAARQGFIRIGLHDEVEVIRENRELDDSQAKATSGRSKAALEDAEAPLRPEVPDTGGDAQSNVKSADSFEPRARVVRDERAWSLWFAPGAVSPSTSGRQPEFELAPAHLILHFDTGEIARGV